MTNRNLVRRETGIVGTASFVCQTNDCSCIKISISHNSNSGKYIEN
jgi:hypothetical protein